MINMLFQDKLSLPKINQNVEGMKFSQDEIDHLDSAVRTAYVRTLDTQDVSAKSELQVLEAKENLEKMIDNLKITVERLNVLEELKAEIFRFQCEHLN